MLKWVAVRNQGMTRVTYFAILHQKSLAGRPELKVLRKKRRGKFFLKKNGERESGYY